MASHHMVTHQLLKTVVIGKQLNNARYVIHGICGKYHHCCLRKRVHLDGNNTAFTQTKSSFQKGKRISTAGDYNGTSIWSVCLCVCELHFSASLK